MSWRLCLHASVWRGELADDRQPGPVLRREPVDAILAPGFPERSELEDQALRRCIAGLLHGFLLIPAEGCPARGQHRRPMRFRIRNDDAAMLDESHAPRRAHANVSD